MYSDILGAADDGKLSPLILLEMSAAFDLVDHSFLLKRLESTYGFDGLTLEWFKNYFIDRANCLKLNSEKTEMIWFSPRWNLEDIPSYSVRVLKCNIFPSKSVKNLGISMDDVSYFFRVFKSNIFPFEQLRNLHG